MTLRADRALLIYPIMTWKKRIARYLWKFILRIKKAPDESWIKQASNWEPNECEDEFSEYVAHRCRGRPNMRWDDSVNRFCRLHFDESWRNLSIGVLDASTDDFVEYFCGEFVEPINEVSPFVFRNVVVPAVPFFRPSTDIWW